MIMSKYKEIVIEIVYYKAVKQLAKKEKYSISNQVEILLMKGGLVIEDEETGSLKEKTSLVEVKA